MKADIEKNVHWVYKLASSIGFGSDVFITGTFIWFLK